VTKTNVLKPPRAREGRSDRVMALLLAGRSCVEICKQERISRSSLWRLRRCQEFATRLKAARAAAFESAVSSLHNNATLFAETLAAICLDPKARGSEKASAARSGLDSLSKFVELFDLAGRFKKVEDQASEEKKQNE
jgi:hypothetical protein